MFRARIILFITPLIMIATAVTSFKAQHKVFLDWKVDGLTAVVAPLSLDLLALLCSLAIHIPNLPRRTRISAILVLVVTGAGSMAANFIAGETVGSKVVHAAMVLLYLMAESIASQVADFVAKAGVVATRANGEEKTAAAQEAETEVKASDAEAEDLPTAPVSPAPVGTGKRKPYKGQSEYSARQQHRHAGGR